MGLMKRRQLDSNLSAHIKLYPSTIAQSIHMLAREDRSVWVKGDCVTGGETVRGEMTKRAVRTRPQMLLQCCGVMLQLSSTARTTADRRVCLTRDGVTG